MNNWIIDDWIVIGLLIQRWRMAKKRSMLLELGSVVVSWFCVFGLFETAAKDRRNGTIGRRRLRCNKSESGMIGSGQRRWMMAGNDGMMARSCPLGRERRIRHRDESERGQRGITTMAVSTTMQAALPCFGRSIVFIGRLRSRNWPISVWAATTSFFFFFVFFVWPLWTRFWRALDMRFVLVTPVPFAAQKKIEMNQNNDFDEY